MTPDQVIYPHHLQNFGFEKENTNESDIKFKNKILDRY